MLDFGGKTLLQRQLDSLKKIKNNNEQLDDIEKKINLKVLNTLLQI